MPRKNRFQIATSVIVLNVTSAVTDGTFLRGGTASGRTQGLSAGGSAIRTGLGCGCCGGVPVVAGRKALGLTAGAAGFRYRTGGRDPCMAQSLALCRFADTANFCLSTGGVAVVVI